jgi:MOSC domain-containing protein YiiM
LNGICPDKENLSKLMQTGKRGVTAWVERPGDLVLGDVLRLHCPEQRAWQADGQMSFL